MRGKLFQKPLLVHEASGLTHGINVLRREDGAAKALEFPFFFFNFQSDIRETFDSSLELHFPFVLLSAYNPSRQAFESLQNPFWSLPPPCVLLSAQNVIRKAFESSQNPLWSLPLPDW